jgi:hypothetical protein
MLLLVLDDARLSIETNPRVRRSKIDLAHLETRPAASRPLEPKARMLSAIFRICLLAMLARVGGVRLQLIDATIDDVQTQTGTLTSVLERMIGIRICWSWRANPSTCRNIGKTGDTVGEIQEWPWEDPRLAVCCAMREKSGVSGSAEGRVLPGTGKAKRPRKSGLGSRSVLDYSGQNTSRPEPVPRPAGVFGSDG